MPLDPELLTPTASINRVRIVDLPGVHLPEHVAGKTAFEVCSLGALCAAIRARGDDLQLTTEEKAEDRDLSRVLGGRFEHTQERVRAAAEEVWNGFADCLAYVLAVVKRGDVANRDARGEWDNSYWQY